MQGIAEVDCSVIVITYNSSEVIERCIRSVFEKNKKCSFEVIVIDNNSKDGTAERVRNVFPQSNVRVIKNNINIGFARAVNQGARLARGKYILLLNPDAFLVSEEPIEQMMSFLENNPNVAAVGGWSEEWRNRDDIFSPFVPQRITILWLFVFEIFTKYIAILFFNNFKRSSPASFQLNDKPAYAFYIGGSCLLTRKDVLTSFPFDERFFLYYEDNDWGEKMRRNGRRLCYLPNVRYVHLRGHSLSSLAQKERETITRIAFYHWLKKRNPVLGIVYRFHQLLIRIPLYSVIGFVYLLCGRKSRGFSFLDEAKNLFLLRYLFLKCR
jgi:GT2 family glycosyltransferase